MHTTNYQTQEQRNQVMKEFLSSHLTHKEFCIQKRISLSSLYRWKTDYQDVQTGPVHFLPLTKRGNTDALVPKKQTSSITEFCSEEIRIQKGDFTFFIREKRAIPLLKLLLEEVSYLAL